MSTLHTRATAHPAYSEPAGLACCQPNAGQRSEPGWLAIENTGWHQTRGGVRKQPFVATSFSPSTLPDLAPSPSPYTSRPWTFYQIAPKQKKLSLKGIYEAAGVERSQGHNLHIIHLEKVRDNGGDNIPGRWTRFLAEVTELPVLLCTLAKLYEVHPDLYRSADKTVLYRFADGLRRYAAQNPDAAWYRALPAAWPIPKPLDVTVQWILPLGGAGTPPGNSTTTISPPSRTPTTAGASTPSTNADAAVADRMTAAADKIDGMEGTLNALATRVGNVEQAFKPQVLGHIIKQNTNPYPGFVAVNTKRQHDEQAAKRRRDEPSSGHPHQISYNDIATSGQPFFYLRIRHRCGFGGSSFLVVGTTWFYFLVHIAIACFLLRCCFPPKDG
ncbi:hypothetical protein FN846DRAFT_911808 [Sphaerosporella brunnea]|uniref:Uncharacterized protein n=1 Tax=Sphaerosporella brunnea TaxID=1250544 RepID=A0A5J5EJP6_9PEZI|nr:hypothetical protein FN846DRAFT_911808 [Sphaerosporella brunnea]